MHDADYSISHSFELTTALRPSMPLGPRTRWVTTGGRLLKASLIDGANRYLLVQVDPDEAEEIEDDLEAMRVDLTRAAGWDITDTEPKLGCVGHPRGSEDLRFRVRQNVAQGWHPGMAASGMVSLALAAARHGSVVANELGGAVTGTITADTPAGMRSVSVKASGDGLLVTYTLSPIRPLGLPSMTH